MPGFLSSPGKFSYNGIVFSDVISMRANLVFIPDSSNRHDKYTQYTITVETIFHDPTGLGDPTDQADIPTDLDTDLHAILEALSRSGGTLIIEGKGLGDLQINTTQVAVSYGPIPQVLAWEPLGDNKAVRCVWTVVFRIPITNSSQSQRDRLVEMNYAISWGITEGGLTRRTITGHSELRVHRDSPSTYKIPNTVDRYRNNFNAPVPLGFKRSMQDWSISEDKRILSFTLVDEELPSDNPYFPGVIRPSLTYSLQSENKSFHQWSVSLSGSIEVAMGIPRWWAWAAFLITLKTRMDASKKAIVKKTSQTPQAIGAIPIIYAMSFSEDVYGRSTNFSISWKLACSLPKLLEASGLWKVDTSITWAGWRQSMTTLTTNWSNRGSARMVHLTNDDALVSYEVPAPQNIKINDLVRRGKMNSNSHGILCSPKPPPAQSWLVFENSITLLQNPNTVSHLPLRKPEAENLQPPSPTDTTDRLGGGQAPAPVRQRRNSSIYRVRMRGYAMRVGYPIPEMNLTRYAGSKVYPASRPEPKQLRKVLGYFCHPVYMARWDKVYIVEGTPPGDLTLMPETDPALY